MISFIFKLLTFFSDLPKSTKIFGFTRLKGNISFGRNVTIRSGLFFNPICNNNTVIYAYPDSKIIIGDNVGISGSTIVSKKSIHIGDRTIIGANSMIVDTDFHSLDANVRNTINDTPNSKQVSIGTDCFIGTGVTILKGVTLGNRCIVGAGAVITKSYPDDSFLCGNPAKRINK